MMSVDKVYEIMFDVEKDGALTGLRVGFLYMDKAYGGGSNRDEKLKRLMSDYPEKDGYKLVNCVERSF